MSYPERTETRRVRRSSRQGRRWTRRLARWPLIRLLAESPAFRLIVILFVLGVISGPLMLMRIWRVSPPTQGAVRISTVDFIQAWSLKRKAREAAGRSDMQNALFAYRAAAANNPADLEALRGGLQSIQRSATAPDLASTALSLGGWLLRMGDTNVADLELIGATWNRCELHERTAGLLSMATNQTSTTLNRLRAAAYFRGGKINLFQELVKTDSALNTAIHEVLKPGGTGSLVGGADTGFNLTSLAYLAGWGTAAERPEALKQLRQVAEDSPVDRQAKELLMIVYIQTRDLDGGEEVFRQLQDSGRAGLLHVTAYATLLAQEAVRGKEKAVALLRQANLTPKTDSEVLRLITVERLLGMYEEAEALCGTYFNDPPWLEQGALIRSDLLEKLNRWDDLRRLAYRLRTYPTVMETLGGYSYVLEGLAEYKENYRDNATNAFQKAVKLNFPEPQVAWRAADALLKLDGVEYAQYAETILLRTNVQAALSADATYLMSLLKCAMRLKADHYLLTTVTKLFELAPDDSMVVNNYAACLLLLRLKPEKAIVHTLRLMLVYPDTAETLINHAVALTMNGRLEEADKLLARVLPDRLLSSDVESQYQLAMFELRLEQGRKGEARDALAALDQSDLFPVQKQWIEQQLPRLADPAPQPGAGGR